MKVLSVFRPINLFIIALTMYLMRWGVILPFLKRLELQTEKVFVSSLSELDFLVLVLSIVFVAAGGYLHNDIMDQQEDAINKPGKNIIGELIDEKRARGMYYMISVLGLALAYYLANKLGNFHLSIIQLVMAVSLWFYSVQFKSAFLAGNFIIAFLIGLVPVTVGIYEVPTLYAVNAESVYEIGGSFNFNFLSYWMLGFGSFAFLFTLAREITKDIEDSEGDGAVGAQTLPLVVGESVAKYAVIGIYIVISVLMVYAHRLFLPDTFTLAYMAVVLLGLGYVSFLTLRANTAQAYHLAGTVNKVVTVTGLLYAAAVGIMLHYQWI